MARTTPLPRHQPERHTIRVDVIDEDLKYLEPIAAHYGWSLNMLCRRIVNRWCEINASGSDIGVIPAPLQRRTANGE